MSKYQVGMRWGGWHSTKKGETKRRRCNVCGRPFWAYGDFHTCDRCKRANYDNIALFSNLPSINWLYANVYEEK